MKYVGKISSNVDKLNILHKDFDWIPDATKIRPSDDINNEKTRYNIRLIEKYGSLKNGIIKEVFMCNDFSSTKKVFIKNKFRYDTSSEHYVMWYLNYNIDELSDDIINMDIYNNIYILIGNNNFDFAWYLNPKMTIPEIFHVQVFWIKKIDKSNIY